MHKPRTAPRWGSRSGAPRSAQQGVALYVVMALVLLSVILGLWASRTALFSEMVTGNDADYQRAYQAAQAMVQDAKDDIYLNLHATGQAQSRNGSTVMQYPAEQTHFIEWASVLAGETTQCKDGICLRRTGPQNFWEDDTTLAAMLAVGARYGQYSGTPPTQRSNPILGFTAQNKGAWYWVEPFPYQGSDAGNATALVQGAVSTNIETDMLYRITAIAFGLKGASANDTALSQRSKTTAVIQTVVALPVNKGE